MRENRIEESLGDLHEETTRVDGEMARLRVGLIEFQDASLAALQERHHQLEKSRPSRVTRCELAKDKAEDANSYLKKLTREQIEAWKNTGGIDNLKWRARVHLEKASSALTLAVAAVAEAESAMLEAKICERQGEAESESGEPQGADEWEEHYRAPSSTGSRRDENVDFKKPRFPRLFQFLRWQ